MSNLEVAQALNKEILLLNRCKRRFGIPSAPVAKQLDAEIRRPLPDVFPKMPESVSFEWPDYGEIDFRVYWQRTEWNPWQK